MDLAKLFELGAKYKTAVREATVATERVIEEIEKHGMDIERMAGLEAALANLSEVNEDRKFMAKCREKGFLDGGAGVARDACPFEGEGSAAQFFWYKGWCQAKNLMPFTEVPMAELFALDRKIRTFCSAFRLPDLIQAVSMRLFQQSGQSGTWDALHPYAKKHFNTLAVEFLRGFMDVSEPSAALPELPKVLSGKIG